MAQLLTSDQIIALINQQSQILGFYLMEVADKISGYQICACHDTTINGQEVIIMFKRDLLHLSRYYTRDEVAEMIKMLSTVLQNITNSQ